MISSSFSKTLEKDGDDEGGRRGEKRKEGFIITRPKGGNTYLCMDSEEIKACKDLGFELEEEKLKLQFDSTLMATTSIASTNITSNTTDWRISKPGDDPRDVKARLKLWAQAVVQASSSSSHRRARG